MVDERRFAVRPGQPLLIGRDPKCQVHVDVSVVSRRHAEVAWTDEGWVLRDLGSSNGTFVGGRQVQVVPVGAGVEVRLGNVTDGPVVRLGPTEDTATAKLEAGTAKLTPAEPAEPPEPPVSAPPAPAPAPIARGVAAVAGRTPMAAHAATGLIRIGRGADNDIVLDQLSVSRHHAEVRPLPDGGFEVADLGSTNGTFHNGQSVTRAPLREGDLISVGRHQFVFDGRKLTEFVDDGPVSLVADDLMVRIGKQVLLNDVSFALPSSSLVAVIGPSGCGKSTLVRAMTGLRPATSGRVRYDGRDLYADYAELRYRIGVVPQDDVLHRQLTVRRALRFSAALRFASDVPRKQRHAKVDEVLETH